MKVYMNRRPIRGPWGGGNAFFRAYHEYASQPGLELVQANAMNINPDVILLAGLENESPQEISVEQAVMYKMYMKPDCKIVLRVNENDARKGTNYVDDMLLKVSEHIDATVFVSHWLKDHFDKKGWACNNNTVIYNGVDKDIFKPNTKFNNGKLNIVAHHWSDNRMKGADIYEQIDKFVGENSDKFTFTYIGRHQCNFQHTKVIKPLSGKALGDELGKYDVYVSASRFDPGPNHVIESIACGLPTYVHKDGGGCVEFASVDAVFHDWETLKLLLNMCAPGMVNTVNHSFRLFTWQECVKKYNDFLESVWKANT